VAENATIQIMSEFNTLNSTQPDDNGFYNTSMSFSGP